MQKLCLVVGRFGFLEKLPMQNFAVMKALQDIKHSAFYSFRYFCNNLWVNYRFCACGSKLIGKTRFRDGSGKSLRSLPSQ